MQTDVRAALADEREKFEAWAIADSRHAGFGAWLSDAAMLPRDPGGEYRNWTCEMAWQAWQARAALAASPQEQAEPEGWQLVPKEPTPEMVRAALDCEDADPEDGAESEVYFSYRAMLAAAPKRTE